MWALINKILQLFKYLIRKTIVFFGYYSKPDFIIVGAQKSGTSALFEILKQHTEITGAIKKEIHFFDNDDRFPNKKYNNYHLFFPFPYKVPSGNLLFEATPSYLFKPNVAERIFAYNKNIKIIISLRNPVDRALSAWTMFHYGFKNHHKYNALHDKQNFSIAIDNEMKALKNEQWNVVKPPYVQTGIYFYQIEKYYNLFPKENILIIEHSELQNNHNNTIEKICNFLNLPFETLPQKKINVSVKENKHDYDDVLKKINEFYKPYNEKLFQLIGKRYNW
ncbi:MAG: sulfotransferase domain-containing protein [Bacteroidia bacterium]|nr:sulfotransferase domain-containing protein [Bacteroidia bacterium]